VPLITIDIDRSLSGREDEISTELHQAFIDSVGIPDNDKWYVFRPHEAAELIYDPTHGGVDRHALLLNIQVTLVRGYDVSSKYELFQHIARRLDAIGIRHEDILVSLNENGGEDWYAGKERIE
jgi:hypothetical protein